MYLHYFILILFSVYFSYSFGKINDEVYNENNEEDIINQFETKMKALFASWKAETNRKLESIEQMIPDLEDTINRKLYTFRNSITDKLEVYIDSKLNDLEKNIPEMLKQNPGCHLLSKKVEEFEENLNFKLAVLAKNISMELDGEKNCNSEALKKITDLENHMNRKFEDLAKKIPMRFEESINLKIDALANNISKEFEENINFKSDILKKITHLEVTMNQKLEGIDNKISTKLEQNINLKFDDMTKNISNVFEISKNCIFNTNKLTDNVDNKHHELDGNENNASEAPLNIPEKPRLPCINEESIPYGAYGYNTEFKLIDDVSHNHFGKMKRNSTGHLTYFELYFAVKTDRWVGIYLSEKNSFSSISYNLWIAYGEEQKTTLLYNGLDLAYSENPGILSPTQFRVFYIKIYNGKLLFGKEGDSTPLLTYPGADLGSLNYYHFNTDYSPYNGAVKMRFCPAAV